MLLTAGAVVEFVKFIQILCWIILPVFVILTGVTIYLHYRKKKMQAAALPDADEQVLNVPEQFNHRKSNGEYILFDHSELIGGYKKRISTHQARYTALHHDFSKLESRYTALAHFAARQFNHQKNYAMENYPEQLPQQMKEEINLLIQQHAAEKQELQSRLEQLGRSYQSLEEENESLQEQAHMEHATEEEKEILIDKWKSENSKLKERVAEQDYLKDILEEKKSQINYLQNQMEQRIMQQHQSEYQRGQLLEELQAIKLSHAETKLVWEEEMTGLQSQFDQTHHLLQERQQQLEEKEQVLASRINHVKSLEDSLSGLILQVDTLQSELLSRKEKIELLETQSRAESERAHVLEEKLASNRLVLRRLYTELPGLLGEEAEPSPVISLRPAYVGEHEESLMS